MPAVESLLSDAAKVAVLCRKAQRDTKHGRNTAAFLRQYGVNCDTWDVSQPSRGLGDVIAKVTHATGLDKAADWAAKKLGKKGCGCAKRQAALNSLVPFKAEQAPCPLFPICEFMDGSPGGDDTLPPLSGPTNLAWFVWPRTVARDVWQPQLETIRAAFDQFDGKKFLYIATDDSTSEGEIDLRGWDSIQVAPNDPQGREVPGWRWLMEAARREPGCTVWLHAKGVWRGQQELHLKRWSELAYQTMLDVPRVRKSLERNLITGCFRRNNHATNLGVPWHYSGSFYAVRNDAITFPESNAGGWYAEAWPGLVAPHELAGCLAFDGCGDLYQASNWKEGPA